MGILTVLLGWLPLGSPRAIKIAGYIVAAVAVLVIIRAAFRRAENAGRAIERVEGLQNAIEELGRVVAVKDEQARIAADRPRNLRDLAERMQRDARGIRTTEHP